MSGSSEVRGVRAKASVVATEITSLAFGSLAYYRRLPLTVPLTRGVYLGGSLEVGELEDTDPGRTVPGTRFGSSLFLGVDTVIGPAYLGLGLAGDGNAAGYVIIGWP